LVGVSVGNLVSVLLVAVIVDGLVVVVELDGVLVEVETGAPVDPAAVVLVGLERAGVDVGAVA
jgi:hypothetical protein